MLDLNVYSFPPTHNASQNIPGLLVVPATRKAARGRENDLLVLYFSLSGSTAITSEGLNTWLEKKAESYHRAPGTVTAGMRAVIDGINADLLERNLRHSKAGGQVSGHLQIAVIKREMLYMATLGSGKTLYATNNESSEMIDAENGVRGLGVNQSVAPRFIQTTLATNDVLIFSFNAPDAWTGETLNGCQTLPLEALFRRLYGQPAGAARGVLIRFKEGTGKVNFLSLRPGSAATERKVAADTPVQAPAVSQEQTPTAPQAESPVAPQVILLPGSISESETPIKPESTQETIQEPTSALATSQTEQAKPVAEIRLSLQPNPQQHHPQVEPVKPQNETDFPKRAQEFQSDAVKSAVGKALRKGAEVKGKADGFMKDAVQKVLPGEADQPPQFPRALLIIIAIVIPIIIVAVAFAFYNRNGRTGLFDAYLAQAEQISVRADGQSGDLPARLASLQESLYWLNKADDYGGSDQSAALRAKLQSGIDDLQGIIHINIQSILSDGLLSSTNISQIVTTATDFYALDDNSGKVLRFFLTGSSYGQDNNFNCGPSDQNLVADTGKIVDMVAIPSDNTYGATLLTIDSKGVLDYCVPGEGGYIVSLEPPDMGWGSIKSISFYQNYLYVLDIQGNAVYRFKGAGVIYSEKPTLFFDDVIPSLKEALDIEVVGYELYILRSNGQMVECTYSPIKDMKSTDCQDPGSYTDTRSGQVTQVATFPEAQFVQMRLTQAPDSSLYLLDSKGDTIYHLSYARSLQRVLHPRIEDGVDVSNLTPTAFAISSGRVVFMAYGNELFYGQMP